MTRKPANLFARITNLSQANRLKEGGLTILLLISLIVNILAPILALQWQRLPFLGLFVEPLLVVASVSHPQWATRPLLGNELVVLEAVNGEAISFVRNLPDIVNGLEIGDQAELTFRYLVSTNEVTLTVPVQAFAWPDFLSFFGIPYFVGLIYLATGLFVYYARSTRSANWTFISFCLLFATFTATLFNIYTYHQFVVLWTAVIPILGALLIHIGLIMPIRHQWLKQWPILPLLPYVPAIMLSGLAIYSLFQSSASTYILAGRLSFAFVGLSILAVLGLLFNRWRANYSPPVKRQSAMIAISMLCSFAPILIWIVATSWLGLNIIASPISYLIVLAPTLIFPITVARLLLRHQAITINQAAQRIMLQVGLILVLILGYWSVMTLLNSLFDLSISAFDPAPLVVYSLVALIFLEPLRRWLIDLSERIWPSDTPGYVDILEEYTPKLVKLPLDVDAILALYLEQVQTAIHTGTLVIFFIDAREIVYNIRTRYGKQEKNPVQISYDVTDTLPTWLSTTRTILHMAQTGTNAAKIAQEEMARLSMLDARLAVPLVGTERLLGWLVLGNKHNGSPYQHPELNFLTNLSNQTAIALENAQRFATANRKTQEQLVLRQTSLDIAQEQDTQRILRRVLERAQDLLNAMGGSIYLLDSKKRQLKNEVSINLGIDFQQLCFEWGQGIAGNAASLNEPQMVKDYNKFLNQPKTENSADFGAVLAIPFAAKGRLQGVLELVRPKHGAQFDQHELSLLNVLANQTAIALENARLIKEAHDKAAQLTMLNEVSNIISSTLDRDATLELIARQVVEVLGTEAGSIFLSDKDNETLTFEIALGPAGVQLVGHKILMNRESIAGSIAVSRTAMIVNDVANDPHWNTSFDEASDFKTRSILGVPMIARNKVVGVIEVINNRDGSDFDENDERVLTMFANQAAIALVNAERFTSTDQALASRVQELNMLQIIDQELNATLELDSVLNLLLENTMTTLGADVGLIGMVDEENEGLQFRAISGMPRTYKEYREKRWPLHKGTIGQVAIDGIAQLVTDDQTDNFSGDSRPTSQLCVPILADGNVLAVMSLMLTSHNTFSEKDQEFAAVLATHAVLAIRNALLFEQVQSADLAKTEFMSVASHELKIPMTSIKGYAKLLGMVGGDLTDQQQEFLEVISANIDRMDRLVQDLLDVSRIEAGRIQLEKSEVSINKVIDEVLQAVSTEVAAKSLQLEVDVPDTIPPIWADYGRLAQVMTNLISNAYKYTPKGGKVAVNATKSQLNNNGQYLSISVQDTGYGISAEDQKSLFTKFFRASDPDIRDQPGTGLGLAITKSLIEIHGGEIWVKSVVGEGSTFGFDLPLTPIPEGAADSAPAEILSSAN